MDFREDVCLGMRRPLSPPLMNGGGCCKTLEDVRELSRSLAGAILVGSITMEKRLGNPGDVWWVGDGFALNSLGMPNGGRKYLQINLPEMATIAHGEGKVLIVNVAGFDPQEYACLTGLAIRLGADAVELNLGCPNIVKDDGSRKPIASFNLNVMEEIVSLLELEIGKYAPIWVKVSPYSDPELLKDAAAVLLRHPIVKAVTAINTFPSAYELNDAGKSVIDVGLAGMSGQALKPIGLGQVKQWNSALQGKIDLIGVGGISTGSDINKYRMLGAQAFQMTTELLKSGKLDPRPFEKVAAGYLEIAA
jgi:dihydroorotate dehydrogenase